MLRFLRVLRYRKVYVITSLLIAAALGTFYYLSATPIYQANASLLVTPTGADSWKGSIASSGADALIPTYERLFHSSLVLKGAVESLLEMPPAARIDFANAPRDAWSDLLRQRLSAQAIRRTNIIELSYRSQSREAAEAVLGAVVESYMEFVEQHHRDFSVELVDILEKERKDVIADLDKKQQLELKLRKVTGDLGQDQDGTVVHPLVQRVLSLNDNYITVRNERLQLEASLSALTRAIREGGDLRQHLLNLEPTVGRGLVMNALGLNPEFTEIVSKMEQRLLDARAELDKKQTQYGPTHPEIRELVQTIEGSQRYLNEYQAKVQGRLDGIQNGQLGPMLRGMVEERLAEAWDHEQSLKKQYDATRAEAAELDGQMGQLQMVRNEIGRLQRHHDMLLDRIANLDLSGENVDVRVDPVNDPKALPGQVSPRLAMTVLLCLVGGLGVGIAAVYVADLLDDRFRSPEELKEQVGVPILAMIRKLPTAEDDGPESLQVHVDPTSVESEAFRTLRTTLAFSGEDRQRIAATSSEPGDGKTTVMANLAASYAQAGKRTLLIDCDLRRPGLSKLFQLRKQRGLSDLLRSNGDLATMCQDLIVPTTVDSLDIIPCGPKPPDPAVLLSSPRLVDLIAWAETQYDQILVDCPPVIAASDAAIVGRLVDGVMMIVQPEKNHRRLVLRAAESLIAMSVPLIGIVANRVGGEGDNYYGYGYGTGYGYGYGYGQDEEDDATESEATPLSTSRRRVAPRRAA